MKNVAAFLVLLFLASEAAVAANPTSRPTKTPGNKGYKKSVAKQKETKRVTKDPAATLSKASAADPPRECVENTLLVMPFSSTDEDTQDLIKEVDGEIAETIGEGSMTVWVVRFKDPKKFAEAEKTLLKDKKLKSVERDAIFHDQQTIRSAPNDPYYPQQWHLAVMHVQNAWALHGGATTPIAVLDRGVDYNNEDLAGKVLTGYNAPTGKTGKFAPLTTHGTSTASTMASLTNNAKGTSSPAKSSQIMPVFGGTSSGYTESTLIKAIDYIGNNTSIKLINLSVNNKPPNTFGNASAFKSLHSRFKWYHDTKGGLIFNAGGNYSMKDSAAMQPYLIVVQAVDETLKRASWSNWGPSTWFTAPGTNIWCSTGTRDVASHAGTSYSSPIVCSIAAMVWSAKPSLKNTQVESILKSSCFPAAGTTSGYNTTYGWGIPDAEKAVKSALGQ
jgi:Subtilisin-like serine proteases